MSQLVLLEVSMKTDLPELYDIYFGGQVLGYYSNQKDFLLIRTTRWLTENGKNEILKGCPQLKAYYRYLFGSDLRIYVTSEKGFNMVERLVDELSFRGKVMLVHS